MAQLREMRKYHKGGGLQVVLGILGFGQSHEGRREHFRQRDEHPSQHYNMFAYQFSIWEKL